MKLAYLLVLFPALAWGLTPTLPPETPPANGPQATATASSGAEASSRSVSESNSGGNTLSTAYNAPRQAPSMAAPAVFPTADCLSGLSGALSLKGFGLAFGGNKVVKECQVVVLAQNYAALGLTEAACQALNSTETAKAVFGDGLPGCKVEKPESPAPAAQVSRDSIETAVQAEKQVCEQKVERATRACAK